MTFFFVFLMTTDQQLRQVAVGDGHAPSAVRDHHDGLLQARHLKKQQQPNYKEQRRSQMKLREESREKSSLRIFWDVLFECVAAPYVSKEQLKVYN